MLPRGGHDRFNDQIGKCFVMRGDEDEGVGKVEGVGPRAVEKKLEVALLQREVGLLEIALGSRLRMVLCCELTKPHHIR